MATGASTEPTTGISVDPTQSTGSLIDVEVRRKVATCIGRKWKWLGRSIGVTEPKLENIEERCRNDSEERVYQMLLVWEETKPQEATIHALIEHLKKVERVDLASEISKMVEKSEKNATIPPTLLSSTTCTRALNGSDSKENPSIAALLPHKELDHSKENPSIATPLPHKELDDSKENPSTAARLPPTELDDSEENPSTAAPLPHKELDDSNENPSTAARLPHKALDDSKENPSTAAPLPHKELDDSKETLFTAVPLPHKELDDSKETLFTAVPLPHKELDDSKENPSTAAPLPHKELDDSKENRSIAALLSEEELDRIWASFKTSLQVEHKRLQLPTMPWLKDWELNFEEYYVDLTMLCKEHDKCKKSHLHSIFKSDKQNICTKACSSGELTHPTRILIEGPAGYGKSTLARKLCFDHEKRKKYLKKFQAVVLLLLRDFESTVESLITSTVQLREYRKEHVFEAIKQNQKQILFILDGYDELHRDKQKYIAPLLKGKQFPQATVIVTSREGCIKMDNGESNLSSTNLLQCVDRRIIIQGVTGKNRIRFLKSYFRGCSSITYSAATQLAEKFSFKGDKNMFDSPLYLLLLVIVIENAKISSIETKTQLYKLLFNFILRRMFDKVGLSDKQYDFFEYDQDNPPPYVAALDRFGSMAGEALTERKYSFTEEEILEKCGNDRTVMKLGILTQNDSKCGRIRKSWYEPIHLSFLEFSYAFHIWTNLHAISAFSVQNIIKKVVLLSDNNFVINFLCGLCKEQVPTLVSALMLCSYDWLHIIAASCDDDELLTDSKLNLCELAKAFLPLVPVEYVRKTFTDSVVLKETLLHAVETRKQRVVLEQDCITYEKNCTLPVRIKIKDNYAPWDCVTLDSLHCVNWESSSDWCKLITNQNLIIHNNGDNAIAKFSLIICEAPLDQQLKWLSKFMMFKEPRLNKPLYQIDYWFPKSLLAEAFNEIVNLISQEKVVSVTFENFHCGYTPPLSLWNEFIHCTKQSKQLLDIKLEVVANPPLFTDLPSKGEKRWRRIELIGDIVPLAGCQASSTKEPTKAISDLKLS